MFCAHLMSTMLLQDARHCIKVLMKIANTVTQQGMQEIVFHHIQVVGQKLGKL